MLLDLHDIAKRIITIEEAYSIATGIKKPLSSKPLEDTIPYLRTVSHIRTKAPLNENIFHVILNTVKERSDKNARPRARIN